MKRLTAAAGGLALLTVGIAHASATPAPYSVGPLHDVFVTVTVTDSPIPVRVLAYGVLNPACTATEGFTANCAPQVQVASIIIPTAGTHSIELPLACGSLNQVDIVQTGLAQPNHLTYPEGSAGFIWWPGHMIAGPPCQTTTSSSSQTSPPVTSSASSTVSPSTSSTAAPVSSVPHTEPALPVTTPSPIKLIPATSSAAPTSVTTGPAETVRVSSAAVSSAAAPTTTSDLAETGTSHLGWWITAGAALVFVGGLLNRFGSKRGSHE